MARLPGSPRPVRDQFPKVAMWEERGDPSPKIRKPASLLGNNVGIDDVFLYSEVSEPQIYLDCGQIWSPPYTA